MKGRGKGKKGEDLAFIYSIKANNNQDYDFRNSHTQIDFYIVDPVEPNHWIMARFSPVRSSVQTTIFR